jgi:hypothetical protein
MEKRLRGDSGRDGAGVIHCSSRNLTAASTRARPEGADQGNGRRPQGVLTDVSVRPRFEAKADFPLPCWDMDRFTAAYSVLLREGARPLIRWSSRHFRSMWGFGSSSGSSARSVPSALCATSSGSRLRWTPACIPHLRRAFGSLAWYLYCAAEEGFGSGADAAPSFGAAPCISSMRRSFSSLSRTFCVCRRRGSLAGGLDEH